MLFAENILVNFMGRCEWQYMKNVIISLTIYINFIDSAGYQIPYDAQANDNNVFKFNKSVRQQIMKGTGGVFSTFRGAATAKVSLDIIVFKVIFMFIEL